GSLVRTEATGYGAVYFMENMLGQHDEGIEGKTAVVSGSGNVALYCAERLVLSGAKVLTVSDSSGFIYDPDGLDEDKLAFLKTLKEVRRGRVAEYVDHYPHARFEPDKRPWSVPCELAFPCATQNELNAEDARTLVGNGLLALAEGANMPTTLESMRVLREAGVLFGPA
ncbi:MAG: glutamate dehydrogenase, partial [Gammaproteobacteria bacterium]|nr:glutamate dehydrogenase [Gammaproteobacteria bacterium]